MTTEYTLGKHPAKSLGAVLGVAGTGAEQVAIEFQFTDGPNKDKRITAYLFFTEKTQDRSVESMRYAGFQGDDLTDLSSLARQDVPTVELVLDTEEHNGQPQVKVKWINRKGGPAVKNEMDATTAKTFAERMRANFRAYDAASGQKPAAKANGASKPQSGDPRPTPPVEDVPF